MTGSVRANDTDEMSVAATLKGEIRALLGQGRGTLLAPIALGWGLLLGTRVIYPVVLPYLRTDYGLTLSTAGLLLRILWLGSAVGQRPSGVLADRYSERSVMSAAPLFVVVGLALVVTSVTPLVL
jgi:predicted MFS family arabinose efflux permease